jgi:hypothetical protein
MVIPAQVVDLHKMWQTQRRCCGHLWGPRVSQQVGEKIYKW